MSDGSLAFLMFVEWSAGVLIGWLLWGWRDV